MINKYRNLKASAIIEFALVLPILCLLIFGIIEFSFILYDQAVITDASRQGARYGTITTDGIYPTISMVTTFTTNYCANRLITFSKTPSAVNVTATASGPLAFGSNLTVTVEYTYIDLVISKFMNTSNAHKLKAITVMPYE